VAEEAGLDTGGLGVGFLEVAVFEQWCQVFFVSGAEFCEAA
jgi:hypothetical protein